MADKEQNRSGFLNTATRIVLFLCAILLVPFVKGWAFATLWFWFVVPTFGLEPLTILQGTGCFLLFTLLQKQFFADQQNRSSQSPAVLAKEIVDMLIAPLFIVGSGWIFSQFL
jgi:hypothetical protein